ncbi:MAG: carboxypeptidase-like regulatory domain-containing protein [Bacteroidia bacterium]
MKRLKLPHIWHGLAAVFLLISMPEATAQFFNISQGFRLSGQVISADSLLPLRDVNILNLNLKTGTTTDQNGYFSLQVSEGDSLVFSIVGYERDTLVAKESEENEPVKILLKPRLYELRQATFYGVDNPLVFRQKFINLDLPDTTSYSPLQIPGMKKGAVAQDPAGGIAIQGPISLLYNQFSKQYREIKKLGKLQKEDQRAAQITAKYSREYVTRITGLEGERLTAFMAFCDVKDEFVLSASQLEIADRIEECHENFKKEQQ